MIEGTFGYPAAYGTYVSKSDLVSAALRELIMTGGLKPGAQLRQRDLAARFGVSATPVREALRRLESEGLVSNHVHRGSTVARAAGSLEEKIQIRAVLEGLAASLAAPKVNTGLVVELQQYNDRLLEPGLNSWEVNNVNRQFHFRIYEIANSPLLLSLIGLLWQSFPGGPQVSRDRKDSHVEHDGLVQALARHDGEKASILTRAHILSALG